MELTYVRTLHTVFLVTAVISAQNLPSDSPIDSETRARVIAKAASNIERYYFDEAVAKQMANAVRSKQTSGGYDSATTAIQLSRSIEVTCERSAGTDT